MRYKITLCYDGAGYCGWQTQPGKSTVQGETERAIKLLTGETVNVTASGRTDEGVSALGQTAHFDLCKESEGERLMGGLNHFLPPDIRVIAAEKVADDFNARKCAKRKTYIYAFYRAAAELPLLRHALRLKKDVDLPAMRKACALFEGTHDFVRFRCEGSSAKTTVRTVFHCFLEQKEDFTGQPLYVLSICADGFLYKMVRIIAGAVLRVGYGDLDLKDVAGFLSGAPYDKYPAPPHGLCLKSVEYV